MSKATKRWQKTRAYVRTLPNLNALQLKLFENICGEIELDEEEIGEALHVSQFTVGDKAKRVALRALELATIVEKILTTRISLGKNDYKTAAATVRSNCKKDSQSQLDQAVVTKINGLQPAPAANSYRVYIEDATLGHADKMSVDLPLLGNQTVKAEAHEKTWKERLPAVVNVGPSIKMTGGGPWGVLPYLGEGNQDAIVFGAADIRSVWTNDISYCVPVAFLYGALPEYTALTFTHLPGGDVSKCNWDWMFLHNLPGNKALPYGSPSRVIVAYNPSNLDASTLECLEVLKNKVPAQHIVVYGFTTGTNFAVDKFGYFGMIDSRPTSTSRYDQKPNYFGAALPDWLKQKSKS